MTRRIWTEPEIRALGVRTDVETAGSILGLSRTQSYLAVRSDRFPVPVLRVGRRLVVPVGPIRRLLQIDEAGPAPTSPAPQTNTPPAKDANDHGTAAAA